ncbi:Nucleotidyl transferase [Carpediemonas membranifera]|uniref:mannose-1-phosphate guanylyltransferase n=1 Tax=Carpediemonas membranifera TaxID=201153 RepID=A0A8J6E418_9EUKA|nr:Nucleotidyl transferase [Carpediemonas membranifera]|eukprot:KAG9396311.1 Nucleotidyl transferase [Carpediemonas membranifera]
MKALLLIGGFGTRLRPLTFSKSKPCIEFINKPILLYQIEALKKVGVVRIILAVGNIPEDFRTTVEEWRNTYNIDIVFSVEETPMGTAGPLALAADLLNEDLPGEKNPDVVFMFNSDILCEFPLQPLLEYHLSHGHEGTLMTTPVEDPSRFGVIVSREDGSIDAFIEKPKEYVGNHINAGLYCLNRSVVNYVPEAVKTSIERETFPHMANLRQLYSFPLDGFWMDVGKPDDFIDGAQTMMEYLDDLGHLHLPISPHALVSGLVDVSESAEVSPGAALGPNVVVGENVIIGPHARLKNCCIMAGSTIGAGAVVDHSIVGWGSTVHQWARVKNSVLGEDVRVHPELDVVGCKVMPHVEVKGDIRDEVVLY